MAPQQEANDGYNGVAQGGNHEEKNYNMNMVGENNDDDDVTLDYPTMSPLVFLSPAANFESYGVPEGGAQNGWTFAGLAEPFPASQQFHGTDDGPHVRDTQTQWTFNNIAAATIPAPELIDTWSDNTVAPVTDRLFLPAPVDQSVEMPQPAQKSKSARKHKSTHHKHKSQSKK